MNRSKVRSTLYNILSICFTYPGEEVFSWILEGKWLEEMKEALTFLGEESFENSLVPLQEILKSGNEGLSLEMEREYTRLFITGFPHVVAPPYGSVYLEKDGLVFGKVTSGVIRFYQEAGFSLKEDLHDLPDHIAHEFEFMGILSGQESQASGSEKIMLEELQMNFFSRFILPWVPTFCQKIGEQSRSPFYRHLGHVTRDFVHFEKNYLGIPGELNSRKEIGFEKEEAQNG